MPLSSFVPTGRVSSLLVVNLCVVDSERPSPIQRNSLACLSHSVSLLEFMVLGSEQSSKHIDIHSCLSPAQFVCVVDSESPSQVQRLSVNLCKT